MNTYSQLIIPVRTGIEVADTDGLRFTGLHDSKQRFPTVNAASGGVVRRLLHLADRRAGVLPTRRPVDEKQVYVTDADLLQIVFELCVDIFRPEAQPAVSHLCGYEDLAARYSGCFDAGTDGHHVFVRITVVDTPPARFQPGYSSVRHSARVAADVRPSFAFQVWRVDALVVVLVVVYSRRTAVDSWVRH